MRSTPLFLNGRLYHIRYDLNAVWDTEHIVTGGFNSLISKEVDLELCTYLLWSGLKWDNPRLTIQDTEKLILREIGYFPTFKRWVGYKEVPVLFNIATACINELFMSGWYNKPTGKPGTAQTVKEIINSLVKGAQYCGYTGDPYLLTPTEINFFIVTYNERLDNTRFDSNFRMAMICSALFNSKRTKDTDRVWTCEDFMPSLTPKDQSPEQMVEVIKLINAAMGGTVCQD